MSVLASAAAPWPDRALAVLRIVTGLLFTSAGTMKLFGYPPGAPGYPYPLLSQVGVAGILETFGGLALAFGLCTRPVAFVLCGEMAVAYFQFHAPRSFFPTQNGGVAAVLYCFVFLYLTFAGGGAWSLDRLLGRPRH
jgi:putative oxidoreductase